MQEALDACPKAMLGPSGPAVAAALLSHLRNPTQAQHFFPFHARFLTVTLGMEASL
jgi:hypothetical protein